MKPIIEVFKSARDLAALNLSSLEIAKKLSGYPLTADNRLYSKSLSNLDSGAIDVFFEYIKSYELYQKFNEGFDCNRMFRQIGCPIMLVQADALQGGILSEKDVQFIASIHPDVCLIKLNEIGHSLGLDTGNVSWVNGPLIRFLESLR